MTFAQTTRRFAGARKAITFNRTIQSIRFDKMTERPAITTMRLNAHKCMNEPGIKVLALKPRYRLHGEREMVNLFKPYRVR
jgi:hypothetical protein